MSVLAVPRSTPMSLEKAPMILLIMKRRKSQTVRADQAKHPANKLVGER